ncbi:pickpocket protein 28-like [Chironomus tepperi]|uniref:pickpocket protein 28-like n=1 Tax=Chironomus tepperi TaxID=113505 RepID=UPI00391F96DE
MSKFVPKLNYYFENTTLHGFSYIPKSHNLAEKLFWLIALLCSFACCSFLLHGLILKVERNPIIVDRPEIAVHIKDIQFPAISICSGAIQNGSTEILSLLHDLHNISYLYYIRNKCAFMWAYKECYEYDMKWKQFELAMHFWMKLYIDFAKKYEGIANLTLSAFGWCKTFNIIGYDDMFHANTAADYFKYQDVPEFDKDSYLVNKEDNSPFYAVRKEAGFRAIWELNVKGSRCLFSSGCNRDSIQTTVVIHAQHEMPDVRHRKVVINIYEFLKIAIEPQIKITDETLLGLDVDERKCYQPDEKKLKFFRTYSSVNCLKECESSFIMEKCHCVPFYFISNYLKLFCGHMTMRQYDNVTMCPCDNMIMRLYDNSIILP